MPIHNITTSTNTTITTNSTKIPIFEAQLILVFNKLNKFGYLRFN